MPFDPETRPWTGGPPSPKALRELAAELRLIHAIEENFLALQVSSVCCDQVVIKGEPCKTVACLGGHYLLYNTPGAYKKGSRWRNPDGSEILWTDGVDMIAADLGFESDMELLEFMDTPAMREVRGVSELDDKYLFEHPEAWGWNPADGDITLEFIADKLEEMAQVREIARA